MSRWKWVLLQITRRLWFRATLIGLLGVFAAMLAAVVEPFLPWNIPGRIAADSVDRILNILASSMLAVTTFSLSVMTMAYGAASSSVSPRATRLLMEDRTTQNVLSTFIGSFLFGIVGIVALKVQAYGDRGRVILFVFTIGVILLVVISLLRWIDHLTRLGRMGETTDRVEAATARALDERWREPYLGGLPPEAGDLEVPAGAAIVEADRVGYVQYVDMEALSRAGDEADADVVLMLNPGAFVFPGTPLAWMKSRGASSRPEQEGRKGMSPVEKAREAFAVGVERSFDQDPRFGLSVLGEIGSRALSPAMNDSGTAIDVIGRAARLLEAWSRERPAPAEPRYPRVRVPTLATADLFEDAFLIIGRDGAARLEVQLRLHKTLASLAGRGDEAFRAAARLQARIARERSLSALTCSSDLERLRKVAG